MYNFYKGFCPTKNKACLVKFSDSKNLKSYEDVKNYSEFCGVLNTNSLLLDIDDSTQAELLLQIIKKLKIKTKVIKTTRGKHFLFKNSKIKKCYTHCQLALGLIADIKVGSVNSYQVLKYNNELRPVEYELGSDGEYDELPYFLTPTKLTEKKQIDFLNLHEGSRNDTLFKYILILQSCGLKVEDIKSTIRLLNTFLLKSPLTDEELNVVLRDEAFRGDIRVKEPGLPDFFSTKGVFYHETFAKHLKQAYHIKRINGRLHIYIDGVYISDYSLIEHQMTKLIFNLSKSKRKETLDYLELLCVEEDYRPSVNYICFNNGLLSLKDFTLTSFNPDIIITNKINHNYNVNAKSEIIDAIMNNITVNDNELKSLLYQMVGYTMFPRNNLGKAFILTGDGSNGKSTFLKIIRIMLGSKNYSSLDLKYLGDRFSTVMILNKLANLADDIDDSFIEDTSLFKKIVTGETITGEYKGQQRFDFDPYCKIICSTNAIPRFGKGKDSKAISRRIMIIPFNADFSESKDKFIEDKMLEEESIEYFILNAVNSLKKLLTDKDFIIPESVKKENESFARENDPILDYFDSKDEDYWKFDKKLINEVYVDYCSYCVDNGYKELGRKGFVNRFLKRFKEYENKQFMEKGVRDRYFVNKNYKETNTTNETIWWND